MSGTIGEERLLAWYHGELPEAEAAEVTAALTGDEAAQAMLAGWRAQDAAMDALFAPVTEEPIPPRLTALMQSARGGRRQRLLALAAMLLLGLAAGWSAARLMPGATDTPALRLAESAIAAHETYVVEVVHPVEVPASEAEHLVGWVAKRLGQTITPPDFAAEGFRLMGGRVLPGGAEGRTAAQFMYENDLGRRISLYVMPSPEDAETAFQFTEEGPTQSFWWVDRGLSYAVVGDVPREALRGLALAAYDQLI